jgi:hypothetical protein
MDVNFAAIEKLSSSTLGKWNGSKKVASLGISRLRDREEWKIPFCRNSLREFCIDRSNSADECAIAVMAWGGLPANHAKKFACP